MSAPSSEYSVEDSPFGRVVIPVRVPPEVVLFYTSADFDGRLGDGRAAAIERYVHDRFGIHCALSTCIQVHGKSVHRAMPAAGWKECDSCDALWTDQTRVALGIKVADCLPVSMVDPVHHVIANVHSGWRGAVQRITDETIGVMETSSGFAAPGAYAFLGPAIRQCCFEVGEEVVEQFLLAYPDGEAFVDRSGAKAHIDIAGVTAMRLEARGFPSGQVVDTGLCTRCDGSMFHSYRRGSKGTRNLAVLAQ